MYFSDYLTLKPYVRPNYLIKVYVKSPDGKGRAEVTEFTSIRESNEFRWAKQAEGFRVTSERFEIK